MEVQRGFFGFSGFLDDVVDKLNILVGKENIFDVVLEIFLLDSADNFGVHFHFGEGVAMAQDLIFDRVDFFDSFINEEIGVLDLFFAVQPASLTSKSLIAEVLHIEFPDNCVIKFEPFILPRALLD